MTVQWGDYQSYRPAVAKPMKEASRKEARAEFNKLMSEKGQRIEELGKLLENNGIQLRSTDEGLQQLDDWFCREIEANPEQPERLKDIWYAVVNDVALFIGEVMIERYPTLKWGMPIKWKKEGSYQRHAITGFTKVPNPDFNVDVDRLVAMHGYRIFGNLEEDRKMIVNLVLGIQDKI